MGRATGRYLKPSCRLVTPGVVFALAVRTAERADSRHGVRRHEWYGAHCLVTYRRRGKWTAPLEVYVSTPDALRDWMGARALERRVNWVIAPFALDALTLSRWWDYAERKGVLTNARGHDRPRGASGNGTVAPVRIDTIGTSGRCDLCEYTDDGTRWRWVGARNYWPDSRTGDGREPPVDGHDTLGVRALGTGAPVRRTGDVAVLLSRFVALTDWWGRTTTAPFGRTAGQLAVGVLRSHVAPRVMCEHRCEHTAGLERSACYGGRASVWYTREIPAADDDDARDGTLFGADDARCVVGPVAKWDVSSMYPALLRDERYPVFRRGLRCDVTPAELIDLARDSGVVARCRVATDRGEYPLRRGGGVCYPTGEYVTTLAGPDVLALAAHGAILKVHSCAVYDLGRPFVGAMEALLASRAEAVERGDDDGETFAKLCANSLAGRLAMREGGWVRESALDEPGRWGEEAEQSVKTGAVSRFRWLCGAAYRWDEAKLPRGPYCAAFAYLSAYGRQHMRRIRDTLPVRSVVSQHTDGLYLLPSADRSMIGAGIPARPAPGLLRREGSADSGRWWGPSHYRWGAEWVLSGYHDPVIDPVTYRVTHSSRTPLLLARPHGAPSNVVIWSRQSAAPSYTERGRIGEDGWVLPPHILPGRQPEE